MAASWSDFVAGTVGGGAGIAVGQPLDTIRIRMQTGAVEAFTFRKVFAQTLKAEGVYGLYRGLLPPLLGISALNCILFGVYGNAKRWLAAGRGSGDGGPVPLSHVFLAGSAAGAASCIITVPIDLVKCRLQVVTGSQRMGVLECVAGIVRLEGVSGLFTGALVTFWRDVPSYGLYYVCYEGMSRYLAARREGKSSSNRGSDAGSTSMRTFLTSPAAVDSLIGGGLAGCAAWSSCYPLDVIKSRLQTQPSPWSRQMVARYSMAMESLPHQGANMATYSGIVDCARKSVQTEGWQCLTRGLGVTLLRAFPVNAVTFFVYELALSALPESGSR